MEDIDTGNATKLVIDFAIMTDFTINYHEIRKRNIDGYANLYLVGGNFRDELLGACGHREGLRVVGATVDEMLAQGHVSVGKDFPVFLHPETGEANMRWQELSVNLVTAIMVSLSIRVLEVTIEG